MTTLLASLMWLGLTEKAENTLTIKVSGIKNKNGYISVALHDGSSDFPNGEGIKTVSVDAERGTVEIIIEGVPDGEYAIALMHDENANDEFDMDANGMPLEGWGFSNNPEPAMGPASWSEASFDVEGDQELAIDMVYLNY